MVTWRDCTPAIQNGATYDRLGVFSGSIVSRLIEGKRVLFLFYTSVAALPIHWSATYLEGCESQSVAFSTDLGASWHRYEHNPLLSISPHNAQTTGWRDPFVSRWSNLSTLLGVNQETNYMMLASGKKDYGPQLQLYQSDNLLDWTPLGAVLDVKDGAKVSPTSDLRFGKNFECASFFTVGDNDYMIVGIEEDKSSIRHNGHCVLWLSGKLHLENGKPNFKIMGHGMLDNGVAYAAHVFRDAENRLIQLGWADETAEPHVVESQGWAGCLAHPRELYEISRPIADVEGGPDLWWIDEASGTMTTLGIRPATQVSTLRINESLTSVQSLKSLRSTNYEIRATFKGATGKEKIIFNLLESSVSSEVTKLVFDLPNNLVTLDRSASSLENNGVSKPDIGSFHLLSQEDLEVHIFVDKSIIEVFINDRFSMTSRVYPCSEYSNGVSYDFGGFDEENVKIEVWDGLKKAWAERNEATSVLNKLYPLGKVRSEACNEKAGSIVSV